MTNTGIVAKWQSWTPYFQSLLRIVAALTFILAGTMKLFAFPMGLPPDGGTAALFSLMGLAGVLETFGGLLMLLGLFTRPTAFILAGEMAFAYFMGHAWVSFWPTINQGVAAMLYCFIWLYFSSAGAHAWALDLVRKRRRESMPM